MSRRRLSLEEAWELGQTLPPIGRPFKMLSRSEWERLPRWRRLLDRMLFSEPPKGYGEPRPNPFRGR
jgi:hypothetical protein